jgi:hypothetical protein
MTISVGSPPVPVSDAQRKQLLRELGAIVENQTAAQLTALAAASGLTPYATYVASDESPYQQWALDVSTLGSPLGGEYMDVQVAGASGGVIVV